jgi:hypothetical protein
MTDTSKPLLSQAEYARSRKRRGLPGGTREAVRRAIADGRISCTGTDKLIDSDVADGQWEKNTRLRILVDGFRRPSLKKKSAQVPDQVVIEQQPYVQLRVRREAAQAERAEIETAKLNGNMAMRDDVDRAWFEIGREFRDQVQTCARRIASEVAGLSTPEQCEAVLVREYRGFTDRLTKGFHERLGAGIGQHPSGANHDKR